MIRQDETGVGPSLHITVLTYEANLLSDHVESNPSMNAFSKAVNAAVQAYLIDRIRIVSEELGD